MTTSEHADLIARLEAWIEGDNETPAIVREAIAALASTPSPAQPTEASEREALARVLNPRPFDAEPAGDVFPEPEMQEHYETIYAESVKQRQDEVYEVADAILAAGFRLAPSPVQGADDRLAQAEAVIADALTVHPQEWPGLDARCTCSLCNILATYQQSPQAGGVEA